MKPLRLSLGQAAALSWRLLLPGERRAVLFLGVLMALNGILQSVSLAAFIPLIGVVLQPGLLASNEQLAAVHAWMGRPSPQQFYAITATGFVVVVALQRSLEFVYVRSQNALVARVERRVSVELFQRCLMAPYVWFLGRNRALLVKEIMGDVTVWARTCLKGLLSASSNVLLMFSVMTFFFLLSPTIALGILLAGSLVTLLSLRFIRPAIASMSREKQHAIDDAYRIANHALVGSKDVKLSGTEDHFIASFDREFDAITSITARTATIQTVPAHLIQVGVALATAGFGLYVSRELDPAQRAQSIAVLGTYALGAMRLLPVFNQATGTIATVQSAIPSVEAVHGTNLEVAQALSDRKQSGGPPELVVPEAWRSVQLCGVSYRYSAADRWALRDIDLMIVRRRSYAIVGRSAAGKSTLVDLVIGLLDPTEGDILIDDVSLRRLQLDSWQRRIGYVPQAPYLADASLRENVALGIPTDSINDGRVLECLRMAGLGDLSARLPGGLHDVVGDFGQRLSGGQKQRIAIARALYQQPDILVLDEPTSAVDSLTEREILSTFEVLRTHLTIVVIAHRISTIRHCDELFLLDEGQLIASGDFESVQRNAPLFRSLVMVAADGG